jgi:hypothetical protein
MAHPHDELISQCQLECEVELATFAAGFLAATFFTATFAAGFFAATFFAAAFFTGFVGILYHPPFPRIDLKISRGKTFLLDTGSFRMLSFNYLPKPLHG